jgi:hypothetical protein
MASAGAVVVAEQQYIPIRAGRDSIFKTELAQRRSILAPIFGWMLGVGKSSRGFCTRIDADCMTRSRAMRF